MRATPVLFRRALSICATLLCWFSAGGPACATSGAAAGKVGLVDTPSQAYGFSATTNVWTPRTLDSPAVVRMAGEFLGYLRSSTKIFLYNSTNDRWVSTVYSGTAGGEEVEGATAVFWSSTTLYGCAAHWTVWKTMSLPAGEVIAGGGSAGSFGLAWSAAKAYAFFSAPGTWITQDLDGPCLGGIASDGLGLVWTASSAYSFDPALGAWVHLDLGATAGVSVAGSGDVALVWGDGEAQAYSGFLGSWYEHSDANTIEGGAASGEIALFWCGATAFSFNANTGTWSQVALQGTSGVNAPITGTGMIELGPNPARERVLLSPRDAGDWRIRLIDAGGRVLGEREVRGGVAVEWDLRALGVAAGSYWLEARSGATLETRRIVLLD